eukprot:931983-Rhodomonas_salina.1
MIKPYPARPGNSNIQVDPFVNRFPQSWTNASACPDHRHAGLSGPQRASEPCTTPVEGIAIYHPG